MINKMYIYKCMDKECDNHCEIHCAIDQAEYGLIEQMVCPLMVENAVFEEIKGDDNEKDRHIN